MNWALANSTPYSSSVQGGVVMFLRMWVASSLLDIRIQCHNLVLIKDIHVSQNVYELTLTMHMLSSTVLNSNNYTIVFMANTQTLPHLSGSRNKGNVQHACTRFEV